MFDYNHGYIFNIHCIFKNSILFVCNHLFAHSYDIKYSCLTLYSKYCCPLASKIPVEKMQSHLWCQLMEFFSLLEMMNPSINNNVTVSLMNGNFHYPHESYFQDKLILQIILEIAFNYRTKQVAFASSSHQYNEMFHYYSYLWEKLPALTTLHTLVDHLIHFPSPSI